MTMRARILDRYFLTLMMFAFSCAFFWIPARWVKRDFFSDGERVISRTADPTAFWSRVIPLWSIGVLLTALGVWVAVVYYRKPAEKVPRIIGVRFLKWLAAVALVLFALSPLMARCDARRLAQHKTPLFCWVQRPSLSDKEIYGGLGYWVWAHDIPITDEPRVYDRAVRAIFSFRPPFKLFNYSILPPPRPPKLDRAEAVRLASALAKERWADFDQFQEVEASYEGELAGGEWNVVWHSKEDKNRAPDAAHRRVATVMDKTGRVFLYPP